jgi:hypothetical protein
MRNFDLIRLNHLKKLVKKLKLKKKFRSYFHVLIMSIVDLNETSTYQYDCIQKQIYSLCYRLIFIKKYYIIIHKIISRLWCYNMRLKIEKLRRR